MPRSVRDEGPRDARIVLVGEAPGVQEEKAGRPFVGPSGQVLERWWASVGLARDRVYVTNVLSQRPPENKIRCVPAREVMAQTKKLHQRIARLDDPWVIVPTGNTALRALVGKASITKHRGSVYAYRDLNGRVIKVIPTLHPASVFRNPYHARRCVGDWQRIATDSQFRELRLPEREHVIRPSLDDLDEFVAAVEQHATTLSIDIETPGNRIACVGFSYDPRFSVTIPTGPGYWGSRQKAASAWYVIRSLCENAVPKVLQNGLFDWYWLERSAGIKLNAFWYDTMAMHHALDAGDDHDLAYLASRFTRQPFWKDEAKDPEEIKKYASNFDALLTYNGIDACVQRELFDVLFGMLVERGRLDFYLRHYGKMLPRLHQLSCHGVRVDQDARARHFAAARTTADEALAALAAHVGAPLHTKKGLSNQRLQYLLYGGKAPAQKWKGGVKKDGTPKKVPKYELARLECVRILERSLTMPVQYKRDKSTGELKVTVDETAIRKLLKRYPTRFGTVAKWLLTVRRQSKIAEQTDAHAVDPDGRIRSGYTFSPENGRFSFKKNHMGTGVNAQNQDRKLRDQFVADEGMFLFEADASQIESRYVYALSGDPELVELARRPPTEYDAHCDNAAIIFGGTYEAFVERMRAGEATAAEQRYLGKRGVHAGHYGMRGATLAGQLLKEDFFFTDGECQEFIDRYVARRPGVLVYQRETREAMLDARCLVNSWGRELWFEHERLDEETYRRGYAFRASSEATDHVNQWGVLPLMQYIQTHRLRARVSLQVHDAVVGSAPPEELHRVFARLAKTFERPRIVGPHRVSITIPLEYKIGWAWGKTVWSKPVEFKTLPSVREVEQACVRLWNERRAYERAVA